MIEAIDKALSRATERLDVLRTAVLAGAAISARLGATWPHFSLDVRANAIVYGVAELEAFTKAVIVSAHEQVNSENVQASQIVPCLRRLAVHGKFTALRDLTDADKVWAERLYTTTLESQPDVVKLPIADARHAPPPLDGRTPTVRHFTLVWSIYGLAGSPFPDAQWLGTLKKLTLARNDLAHGNVPYDEFFLARGYDFADVERYLDHLDGFMNHYAATWDTYLVDRAYLA